MRTDSVNLSDEARKGAQAEIADMLTGRSHIVKNEIIKGKSKGAQEAHEAIRPTDFSLGILLISIEIKHVLYDLIWKRVLSLLK